MTPPNESLGHLELDVLQYVGDHHPITVREVATHFAETTGQARTTLLTVMERLRAKGYLTRRKVSGVHRYTPTIAKPELLRRLVGDFVDDVLGGSVSPFFAYLSKSSLLNADETKKLAQLLKQIESRTQGDSTEGRRAQGDER
jgi:BlaI family penicillinase repressor